MLKTQHRLTTPLQTSRYSARFAQSRGRSICSVRPRLPMSCIAVSIHVRWGRPMGLGWPGMECAKNSCVPQPPDTVPPYTVSHLGLASAGQQLSHGGAIWAAAQDSDAPYMSRGSTRDL